MARHNGTLHHILRASRIRGEGGFSMIEAMVAVTMLLIAIVMSVQPIMASLIRVADARTITIAENLAQAEIESIRALDYRDVGVGGFVPAGVLTGTRNVEVQGRQFTIDVAVQYAGSLTGLDIIAQGGDGVPGAWDAGIDYKVVEVSVYLDDEDSSAPPVVMETIVAPDTIGAHEQYANARVTLARYEPFVSSDRTLPSLLIEDPPAVPVRSGTHDDVQVFPAITPGTYIVALDIADGWVLHPSDIASGLHEFTVSVGQLAETTLRVYRPARLVMDITGADTGERIPAARVTLTHTASGSQTDYPAGYHTIDGIIPDAYDITVSAGGYLPATFSSINIPDGYPDPQHDLLVVLEPNPGGPGEARETVPVTFTVKDNTKRVVNGARIEAPHPTLGLLVAVTDERGRAVIDLEPGMTFTATASTDWGHGSVQMTFDPADDDSIEIKLTRPSGMGTVVLKGGGKAEFLIPFGDPWMILPANENGQASFVAVPGPVTVAKRCLDTGSVMGTRTVWVRRNRNASASIWGRCP